MSRGFYLLLYSISLAYSLWPIGYGTYIAGFLLSHKSLGILNIVYSSKSAQSKRMYISPNNYFRFLLLLLFPKEASLIYWKRADSPNTVEASTLYSSCSPLIHKGALSRRRVIICARKEKEERDEVDGSISARAAYYFILMQH